MQHKLPRSPSDRALTIDSFERLTSENRTLLINFEFYCLSPLKSDPYHGKHKQVHAAFNALRDDRIKLYFLILAASIRRCPSSGCPREVLSGLRAGIEFLKQPLAIVDDYGKETKGIVLPSALTLPEGVEEQGGLLRICDVETEEFEAMRWLCGPYRNIFLKRATKRYLLWRRMLAPDATFAYVALDEERRRFGNVAFYVDTSKVVKREKGLEPFYSSYRGKPYKTIS